MIRCAFTVEELHAEIDAANPTWRQRAADRTRDLKNGTRRKITPMWSEIKPAFMNLQGPKCPFCEKWVEDQAIEQDVEHFRPKNNVKRWRIPNRLRGQGITVAQPTSGSEPGYRLLAYHPENYMAACKTCNSVLKRDYFPISGVRESNADRPSSCRGEKAYLIFPLGNVDDDSEDLIEFHGISPRPIKLRGFGRKRALVTIELFKLDDVDDRKALIRERALKIQHLYFALKDRDSENSTADEIATANRAIANLTKPKASHVNCLRSFQRLWETRNREARNLHADVSAYLSSTSD